MVWSRDQRHILCIELLFAFYETMLGFKGSKCRKHLFLGFWGIYWSQSRVNLLNHTYSWSACRDLSTGVWYDHFNKDSHEISLKKWSKSEVHAKACTGRIAHPTEMRVSDSYSARSITPENISKTWIALFLFTGMEGVKVEKPLDLFEISLFNPF